MNIAITGSSGFIGTSLKKSLNDNGNIVIPIVRKPIESDHIIWSPTENKIDTRIQMNVIAI